MKVKAWAVVLDGAIVNVSLTDPRKNKFGKDLDLLSQLIAHTSGRKYEITPCFITLPPTTRKRK